MWEMFSLPMDFQSRRGYNGLMTPNGHTWEGHTMKFDRIRDLREDHDKTQQEIASYLGMQRSVYRRYESGERETPAWVIVALADLYQVSTDYLLSCSDEKVPGRKS